MIAGLFDVALRYFPLAPRSFGGLSHYKHNGFVNLQSFRSVFFRHSYLSNLVFSAAPTLLEISQGNGQAILWKKKLKVVMCRVVLSFPRYCFLPEVLQAGHMSHFGDQGV